MSASVTIKNWLIDRIDNCSEVQQVYGYMHPNPSGWAAVFVMTADMEGEFSSNAENSRVYSYQVTVAFPIGEDFEIPVTKNRMQYAEEVIATCIDQIIDSIDTDFDLSGVNIGNATAKYANAADCSWGDITYEGGIAKAAQITVSIYTEKTVV